MGHCLYTLSWDAPQRTVCTRHARQQTTDISNQHRSPPRGSAATRACACHGLVLLARKYPSRAPVECSACNQKIVHQGSSMSMDGTRACVCASHHIVRSHTVECCHASLVLRIEPVEVDLVVFQYVDERRLLQLVAEAAMLELIQEEQCMRTPAQNQHEHNTNAQHNHATTRNESRASHARSDAKPTHDTCANQASHHNPLATCSKRERDARDVLRILWFLPVEQILQVFDELGAIKGLMPHFGARLTTCKTHESAKTTG